MDEEQFVAMTEKHHEEIKRMEADFEAV